MAPMEDEDGLLRSVALQNASAILLARQRAEEELERTKEALRESQERLTAALSAAATGTFRWNIQTHRVEWDGNLDRLFGLNPGRASQTLDAFVAAVHPDDRPAVSPPVRARRATERTSIWSSGSYGQTAASTGFACTAAPSR
jgi:PAS domain-containing protein